MVEPEEGAGTLVQALLGAWMSTRAVHDRAHGWIAAWAARWIAAWSRSCPHTKPSRQERRVGADSLEAELLAGAPKWLQLLAANPTAGYTAALESAVADDAAATAHLGGLDNTRRAKGLAELHGKWRAFVLKSRKNFMTAAQRGWMVRLRGARALLSRTSARARFAQPSLAHSPARTRNADVRAGHARRRPRP
jgi:hypothetical protein